MAAGEISACEAFMLQVDAAPRGEGRRQLAYESACPVCGVGARQIGPLTMLPSELPKSSQPRHKVFETWGDDLLVHASIASDLAAVGDPCLDIKEVEVKGVGASHVWYQLATSNELPPMLSQTTAIYQDTRYLLPCRACGRDGWYDRPKGGIVAYHAAVRGAVVTHLMSATWERMGRSVLGVRLAGPRFIVNSEFRSIMERHRQRHLVYVPVVFLDG